VVFFRSRRLGRKSIYYVTIIVVAIMAVLSGTVHLIFTGMEIAGLGILLGLFYPGASWKKFLKTVLNKSSLFPIKMDVSL
jgi:hypothetical protein